MSDDEATELVMRLMAIPGRSGEEAAVLAAVEEQLRAAGVPDGAIARDDAHRRSAFRSDAGEPGGVGNLIVKLPGSAGGPRRMLSAHADTVPICVGCEPLREGEQIVSANPATGLGADDRAGCAVVLSTALELLRSGTPHPPLTLLWTVQEEVGLHGARNVDMAELGGGPDDLPRLAFNFDGGSPAKVTVGATGGYRMAVEVIGVASHAGNHPERGVSAIAVASIAIADLHRGGWLGLIEKRGLIEKEVRRGASNVGVIQGGAATNVVTDRVTLRAEARSHDADFREEIVAEIEASFRSAAAAVTNTAGETGRVEFDGRLDYESFRLADDDPSRTAAIAAIEAEGGAPVCEVTNGGIDANWLSARGVPTVTLGCGQRNIHTVGERLDLAEFHLARRLALRLATGA
ncbi:MAG: M20/M25/M40 family metallo-hydrolase [Planctomycetota bacterium]